MQLNDLKNRRPEEQTLEPTGLSNEMELVLIKINPCEFAAILYHGCTGVLIRRE